jgi:hypothetical protein
MILSKLKIPKPPLSFQQAHFQVLTDKAIFFVFRIYPLIAKGI